MIFETNRQQSQPKRLVAFPCLFLLNNSFTILKATVSTESNFIENY